MLRLLPVLAASDFTNWYIPGNDSSDRSLMLCKIYDCYETLACFVVRRSQPASR